VTDSGAANRGDWHHAAPGPLRPGTGATVSRSTRHVPTPNANTCEDDVRNKEGVRREHLDISV
jgi:hypothetical protein